VRTFSAGYRDQTDAAVAAQAADAHGVLSLDELLDCGLSTHAVGRRVAAGRLHRIHRGVYAVGHPGLTREGRWLAAVKACGPGALLSHHSAAMLYGFLPYEPGRPHVTVPDARRRTVAGIRVHRARVVHPHDVWRHHGVPVVTAPRAVLEMAATESDAAVRRAMSRAQSAYITNHRQLAAILDRTGARPGRARYIRVLASEPPATRTDLEDRVHDLIIAGGLQPPDVNVPLRVGGTRLIPDFRWPQQRLIVEADSRRWHDNPQARADDERRQALLEEHGERLVRVTWEQAVAHATQTIARIAAAGAPPIRSGGP
jgi:predicted transcriptional regulator of viral defense system/very-short-patch-repair endonuclease